MGGKGVTTQQRDAKGHFLPMPDGPTAKMRALEAEVEALMADKKLLERTVQGLGDHLNSKIGEVSQLGALLQQISGVFLDRYHWDRLPSEVDTLARRCENYGQKAERVGEANTALIQERDNWLADFNKCADSLRDAEITIERQASIIARHAAEEPRSAIVGIIIAAVVALFVGVVMGRFIR